MKFRLSCMKQNNCVFTLRRPTSLKQSSFGRLRMFFSQGIYDSGKNKKNHINCFTEPNTSFLLETFEI